MSQTSMMLKTISDLKKENKKLKEEIQKLKQELDVIGNAKKSKRKLQELLGEK